MGLPPLTTRAIPVSCGPPPHLCPPRVLEPSFSGSLLAASEAHHLPCKTTGNLDIITPCASSDVSSLPLTFTPPRPAQAVPAWQAAAPPPFPKRRNGPFPCLSSTRFRPGPEQGTGGPREGAHCGTLSRAALGSAAVAPPPASAPAATKAVGQTGGQLRHARSAWKSCARFTLRTSCLHFSTLSCNFLSCSGLRDGSALLLVSRDVANFSSLHAAW